MKTRQLTRNDLEGARAETFHMILFAMAWVMIGDYGLHFRDYAAAAAIVLTAVVILGLQTIKLYDLEEAVPDPGEAVSEARERKKRSRRLHWLPAGGKVTVVTGNTLVAYGCAAGAIADGFWIVASVRKSR